MGRRRALLSILIEYAFGIPSSRSLVKAIAAPSGVRLAVSLPVAAPLRRAPRSAAERASEAARRDGRAWLAGDLGGVFVPRESATFLAAVGLRGHVSLMTDFDVVVVGGGAAGLSAALVLSRARRRVLVVDGGMPRNAPAEAMHGFLSRDGFSPSELLELGREEVVGYGGQIVDASVAGVESLATGFRVALDSGLSVSARRLLVATGLRDELPDIPGLRRALGAGCSSLSLLPRLRGARPDTRRPRLGAWGSRLRADRPSVVRRCRLPGLRRNPDRGGARRTGCSFDRRCRWSGRTGSCA